MKPSLAFLFLPIAVDTAARTFYVATGGSDRNNGASPRRPFRTLNKAQEAVRAALSRDHHHHLDITVHVSEGTYTLNSPLQFAAEDSGTKNHPVRWIGDNAVLSGGLAIKGWEENDDGIWQASVPKGVESRNLYVAGHAANYARKRLDNRKDFSFTATGMTWTDPKYDYLMNLTDVDIAEVRFINSFTDRYSPIESIGTRQIVMKQTSWANQIIGWDTVKSPFHDSGVYIQNNLQLLENGGEYFLDSKAGKVYYKPLPNQDMTSVSAYLGIQEAIIVIGGTYDEPIHDLSFQGFTFSHSTWLKPGQGFGYVDQQTGGYIGENTTYPEFEASRPRWHQMPSAIQISAARSIKLSKCLFTQFGAGGIGIGNDDNAHLTGVGLGTQQISITDSYFTQVMGNSITAGGIKALAHHPTDDRMISSLINIEGNIFFNNSALFSSTVNILTTYVQNSTIEHNDLQTAPYSGISHGYGWGSNDAGGSVEYLNRGLYKYQPLYTTPTTSKNNLIRGNLIHDYGKLHTDLAALYTLSRSPGTVFTENYVYDADWPGMYPDEGSSNMTINNNVFFSSRRWWQANDGNINLHTGNMTVMDNWGKVGDTLVNQPNGTGRRGNTFLRNYVVSSLLNMTAVGQKAAYRAGIPPGARADRPVSNDDSLSDGYLSIGTKDGLLAVNVTNFDDVKFEQLDFQVSANGARVSAVKVPRHVPADGSAVATYKVKVSTETNVTGTVTYKNPRTGKLGLLVASGTYVPNA